MKVDGTTTFDAPPEQVWRVLTRPQSLASVVPGVERLEVADAQHWTAHVRIKVGPLVKLRVAVACELVELRRPEFARLHAAGHGPGGGLRMETSFHLVPADDRTRMGWEADVELTGRGAAVGDKLLRPLVDRQVAKVMASLREQVAAEDEAPDAAEAPAAFGSVEPAPADEAA
jgi:uncharacterized protein